MSYRFHRQAGYYKKTCSVVPCENKAIYCVGPNAFCQVHKNVAMAKRFVNAAMTYEVRAEVREHEQSEAEQIERSRATLKAVKK